MNDIYLQKVVNCMREQLDWEIPIGEAFYEHLKKCIEANDTTGITPEEFVLRYRMTFKPKYPDHPTGGALVDGHYGEEGDIFVIVGEFEK